MTVLQARDRDEACFDVDLPQKRHAYARVVYRIEAVHVNGLDESRNFELTPEREAEVEAAVRSVRAGRVVPWETVNAELSSIIANARTPSR